ncbi:MAG: hypothetical protein V4599_01630 [Verrucomicrobiota bacterium]
MTDGQSLLLLFVALYLLECLRWLPPRSLLLLGHGSSWQARRPFQPVELAGGSPALLAFLPPLQAHVTTLPWLLVPAADGLEVRADRLRPLLLPWERLSPRTEGRTLHLAPGHRVRCLSEEQARQAQQQVQQWIPLAQEAREADFLRHAEATLKSDPLTGHAEALTGRTRLLRGLGSLIFLWTFGVLVALYRWLGDDVEMLWAAGVLFVLQFTQAVVFFRRARGLPYRFWKTLAIALLPQHAMRAADHFCQVAMPLPSHPLAARSLLGNEAWKKLAAQMWKQTRYQPAATADLQSRALESFLDQQGLAVADLEPAPAQQTGSALYCPGCQAQFQAGASRCQDCGGIELRAF